MRLPWTLLALLVSPLLQEQTLFAQTCAPDEFEIRRVCYKIASSCSDYNGTSERVCDNDFDKLACEWKQSTRSCSLAAGTNPGVGPGTPGGRPSNPGTGNSNPGGGSTRPGGGQTNPGGGSNNPGGSPSNPGTNPGRPGAQPGQTEPKVDVEAAADLLLSGETREILPSFAPSFVGTPVEAPSYTANDSSQTLTMNLPMASIDQRSLSSQQFVQPLQLAPTPETLSSEGSWGMTSKYAQASLAYKGRYSVSNFDNLIVHSAFTEARLTAYLLGYGGNVLDGRLDLTYDMGPSATDVSDDIIVAISKLTVLDKEYYRNVDRYNVSSALSFPLKTPAPWRETLARSGGMTFIVAGIPFTLSLAMTGEIGLRNASMNTIIDNRRTYMNGIADAYGALSSQAEIALGSRDLSDWLNRIGGLVGKAEAAIGASLNVLTTTLTFGGTVGQRELEVAPRRGFACFFANYKDLKALDGRIYGYARVEILTRVLKRFTEKVCDILGSFCPKRTVEKWVNTYSTLNWNRDFYRWDGSTWPQNKPIAAGCTVQDF